MKNVQKIDLGLTGYDELFANDEERKVNKLPRIFDIPISEIDDFPDHPFKVKIDEDMDQLVQSIKERGIITPVTLRPKEDGRYEIVSGHRRKKACELAGLDTVKAEVREMSRDEAIILMVESNLQRSTMLDNQYALLFIRGERPVQDFKYDILHHPNVRETTDGGAPAFTHGEDTRSIAAMSFVFDKNVVKQAQEIKPELHDFELLSEEELQEIFDKKEKEEHEKHQS